MTRNNEKHQSDLLFEPHNVFEGNINKHALTGVNIVSRYKVSSTLRTKRASEIAFV